MTAVEAPKRFFVLTLTVRVVWKGRGKTKERYINNGKEFGRCRGEFNSFNYLRTLFVHVADSGLTWRSLASIHYAMLF